MKITRGWNLAHQPPSCPSVCTNLGSGLAPPFDQNKGGGGKEKKKKEYIAKRFQSVAPFAMKDSLE